MAQDKSRESKQPDPEQDELEVIDGGLIEDLPKLTPKLGEPLPPPKVRGTTRVP